MLLDIKDLWVTYDRIQAVRGVSLTVREGEIVTLIGANGAGKSTILRAISRLLPITQGSIRFANLSLNSIPAHLVAQQGIAHVPEGRGIFGNLTVLENLRLSTYGRKDKYIQSDLERVLNLFPRLAQRLHQWGNTLSGGEQQMLSLGRALMRRARLLLLDEPSMGLAPLLVKEIFKLISAVNQQGTTVLLVEQNAHMALQIADRGYVIETGQITLTDDSEKLSNNSIIRQAYLGH